MAEPWSTPIVVAQIPDVGLHRTIEADAGQRLALAALADLRDVIAAAATFDLDVTADGTVRVLGRLKARVGQTCVVTLDPIENDLDEAIDLIFAPRERIRELAQSVVEDDGEAEPDVADPLEPIERGIIDLGRIATDALILGLDPYPRKPDAALDLPPEPVDPADHPFAALRALRADASDPESSEKSGK